MNKSMRKMYDAEKLMMLEALGYALVQCHDNCVSIGYADNEATGALQLDAMKQLAALYRKTAISMAHGTDDAYHMARVTDVVGWYVPLHMLARIEEATMLLELYECKREKCEHRGSDKCEECYHHDVCYLEEDNGIESSMPCDNYGMAACSAACPRFLECNK